MSSATCVRFPAVAFHSLIEADDYAMLVVLSPSLCGLASFPFKLLVGFVSGKENIRYGIVSILKHWGFGFLGIPCFGQVG